MHRGGMFDLGSEICIKGDVGARVFYDFGAFGFTNISPFLQKVKNSKTRMMTKFFKSMISCFLPVLFLDRVYWFLERLIHQVKEIL